MRSSRCRAKGNSFNSLFWTMKIVLLSLLLAALICCDLGAGGRGGGMQKDNDLRRGDPELCEPPILNFV